MRRAGGDVRPLYRHSLKLAFLSSSRLPSYSGSIYAPSTKTLDKIEITRRAIEFSFERSSRLGSDKALSNATRLDQIRRAMLFLSAASEAIPKVRTIEYCDKIEKETLELLPSMRDWYSGPNTPLVSTAGAARVFFNNTEDKVIARSLAYLCASRRMVTIASQNDRLRYLWSAFNVLYTHLNSDTKAGEKKKIDGAREYYELNCEPMPLIDRFTDGNGEALLGHMNYYVFLTRTLLSRQGNLRDDWQDALKPMDAFLLTRSKNAFAKLVQNDQKKLSGYEHIQSAARKDELKQALFLACSYAYSLRNAFFHGEANYPLFVMKEDRLLTLTSDILEVVCISIIESIVTEATCERS